MTTVLSRQERVGRGVVNRVQPLQGADFPDRPDERKRHRGEDHDPVGRSCWGSTIRQPKSPRQASAYPPGSYRWLAASRASASPPGWDAGTLLFGPGAGHHPPCPWPLRRPGDYASAIGTGARIVGPSPLWSAAVTARRSSAGRKAQQPSPLHGLLLSGIPGGVLLRLPCAGYSNVRRMERYRPVVRSPRGCITGHSKAQRDSAGERLRLRQQRTCLVSTSVQFGPLVPLVAPSLGRTPQHDAGVWGYGAGRAPVRLRI